MRFSAVLTVMSAVFFSGNLSAQCHADSVVTYRSIAGKIEVASVEYFTFDEKDSVASKTLVELLDGKAQPVNQVIVTYTKSGSTFLTQYETRNWVAERAVYKGESRHTVVKNKKGQLIAEKYDKVGATVVPEAESNYTYNKAGQLITNEFKRWNEQTQSWDQVNRVTYSYTGSLQTESITYAWDTASNNWKNDWKMTFAYDSLNEVSETISYQFKNGAWVPKTRTSYGVEVGKPIKWSLVQEWNGAKENWYNVSYYLFQHNDRGLTDKEIHLTWVEKEWKIDTSFNYVYNEAGMLVQILNEANEVMVNRFCRN